MRNQHMRNEARSFRTFKLATVVLMLVALACCFTVFASALLTPDLTLNEHYAIDMEYSQGVPSKEYDGTDAANVTLTA